MIYAKNYGANKWTHVFGSVEIVDSCRVQVHGMESIGRAINNFESRPFLNRQVHQKWFVK